MVLPGGAGGPSLSSSHLYSLKFIHPLPPLFSSISNPSHTPKIRCKPITLARADTGASRPTATTAAPTSTPLNDEDAISLVTQDEVPLEGVIQFEKPDYSSKIAKIGNFRKVALLAGGDVAALLLFSAVGRFSHGFPVFESETFRTADPFIAGWFLSAYFLGGYGEDGRGTNGLFKAFIAATKSWALGIPLGLAIRAATVGHVPPVNFVTVTMGSTAVLLIGWRTLLFSILPDDRKKKNDVYKRGSPFELFELLTSLVRRW
nr:uncharacterized protein LOC109153188 isoform X1 [Ipomoea batatas]